MKINLKFVYLIFLLILQGCAAALVPLTNDPIEKLNWATELYNNQGRPLPAERLIIEAIDICNESNDTSCLGFAYIEYAFFFSSWSVEKWQKHYKESGFFDKTATFENRHAKSRGYFEKAISKFKDAKKYDALTNAYFSLGANYHHTTKNHKKECESYVKSLEYNLLNLKANPAADVYLPDGYTSYKEYITFIQKTAKCN